MDTHGLEQVHVPGFGSSLYFHPATDFLGKGTVGEVFRARTEQRTDDSSEPKCYALKRFFDHGERPHFGRECQVLEALRLFPHPNIVLFLNYWTSNTIQYMLFPLAAGDLYTCFRATPQPRPTVQFTRWFVSQLQGLCDALKYIHNYAIPILSSDDGGPMRRIGFHHDIKPVNILLFETSNPTEPLWKLSDFGSGLVSEFKSSDHDSIYNSKPSTGDPIYTSPEFALEGRVSRPKDIWSLGCIYLEALIWISDPSRTAVDDFQEERFNLPDGHMLPDGHVVRKPMYWFQDLDRKVHIHPAVTRKMDALRDFCEDVKVLEDTRLLVMRMLTLPHRERATASEVCDGFNVILARCAKT